MKNRKCPNHRACWDYGSCESCELGKEITRLHNRIDRLKNQKETLTISRNAWERLARSYEDFERNKWIPVEDRLPSKDEYLTHHNDGIDSLKRLTIAYMTDTVSYTIGCYDGYKWVNQLGNRIIKDVIAWKPFETYTPPKESGDTE